MSVSYTHLDVYKRQFINSTMAGSIPKTDGTNTEAPNMANMCWMLRGMACRRGGRSLTWMILLDMVLSSFPFNPLVGGFPNELGLHIL